jgi:hypothetical protein
VRTRRDESTGFVGTTHQISVGVRLASDGWTALEAGAHPETGFAHGRAKGGEVVFVHGSNMVRETTGNGRIETTTDHDTIRRWIEERGSTAARVTEPSGDDPGSLAVVPEGTDDDSVEEIPWEEFFEIFEEENLAFVHQTERADPNERWFCRFVDREREREVGEDAFETDRQGATWKAGERYVEGESARERSETVDRVSESGEPAVDRAVEREAVAETEVTRTEIVEKEIIVTDRIRSRVVGSETVERNTLESEVIDREVDRCEIVDEKVIETEVIETRRVIDELFEVHLVESEVIDRETVERVRTEDTDAEIDAVDETTTGTPEVELMDSGLEHETIVESEIVRRALAESDLAEGEVVETEVVERRVIEREVVDRILVRSEIEEVEQIDSRTVGSEVLESEIVERDSSEREFTATAGDEEFEPREDASVSESELAGPTVEVTENDEGKTVVNTYGEEIGVVSAVREGTLYVDPDPGLAEKVTSSFGWGSGDDESYPVEAQQIERITADEVEIERL